MRWTGQARAKGKSLRTLKQTGRPTNVGPREHCDGWGSAPATGGWHHASIRLQDKWSRHALSSCHRERIENILALDQQHVHRRRNRPVTPHDGYHLFSTILTS